MPKIEYQINVSTNKSNINSVKAELANLFTNIKKDDIINTNSTT